MTKELYVVIDRDGCLRERRAGDMTKAETIKDILTGEIDSVAFVYCICPEEGTCRDVTEDIARDVLAETGTRLEGGARDLVEDRIGIRAAAEVWR